MLTDEDYNWIAMRVYEVDPVKYPKEKLSVGKRIDVNGRQFQVIDATGNSAELTTNGIQLIVIAYKLCCITSI